MTSIQSAEENDFINSLITYQDPATWIGGSDSGHEGRWEWSDGSVWEYENWLSGQPNSGTDQNGLAMDNQENGQWRDWEND